MRLTEDRLMSAKPKQTTVMSTKGQVILPKAVRDLRGWRAGTKLTVEDTPDGVILKPEPLFPLTTLDEVYGCLKWEGPPKTLEEMDAGIDAEIAERHARGRY
jgi:AbrB family looped-hinge helix DNA binding protein